MSEARRTHETPCQSPPDSDRAALDDRALYQDLVDALPGGVYRLRVAAVEPAAAAGWRSPEEIPFSVDFVSERCAWILGLAREELVRNPLVVLSILAPDELASFARRNVESAIALSPLHWEGRATVRGEVRWLRLESLPRRLDNGEVLWTGVVEDVTERRRATEDLAESEERFAAAFRGSPVAMVMSSAADGVHLDVNEVFERDSGFGRDEVVGSTSEQLRFFVDPTERALLLEEIQAKGHVEGRPCLVRIKSGEIRRCLVSIRSVPVRGRTNLLTSLLDVTEETRAAEERAEALQLLGAERQLLETVVGALPVGVLFIRGPEHRVEWVNRAYLAMVPGKQVLGRTIEEIWSEIYTFVGPILDAVRATGKSYHAFDAPARIRRAEDGPLERAYFSWSITRTRIPGSDEWGLLNTAIETTDQVRARRAMQALEDRLVLAQEASGSGTWDWDIGSGELTWSPELYRLFGLDPAAQPASFETWRSALHPDDAAAAEERIAASVRERSPLVNLYRIVLPTGEVRWIEARGRASYDEAGVPRRMSGLCIDVSERIATELELETHREHLEDRVRARTAELEAATREMESFSYSVSHDLRAPLRALDGFSATLLEEYASELDEKGRHYLDRIRAAAQRMAELIDALLNLSRLGRRELVRGDVDVSAMARSVAAELHAFDAERTVELRIADGMGANADAQLLRVVLQNLIGNALKSTSKRVDATVEIGSGLRDGERVFFVRDNGVGFDALYSAKLFKPFQRLHGIDEFPGTGIGLATVQRIVDRHGGRVWAESVPRGGASFYFTLPSSTG